MSPEVLDVIQSKWKMDLGAATWQKAMTLADSQNPLCSKT